MVKTNIQTFSGEVEILSNLHVGSYLTANGAASNVLDITGNVGATFFVGDGGFLSNIATTLSDIVNQGNVVSNVVTFEGNTNYAGVGLVTSSNVGIQNTAPSHTLSIGDKIRVNNNTDESLGESVIEVDGRILATRFEGDGGLLSNIATTLESIVNQGNVSANVVKFSSNASVSEFAGAGLVTDSNVGIQNTAPTHNLSVGSNLHVNDTGSNVLTVHGNVVASNLNLGVFSITPAYGLNDVCNTSNGTSNVVQFQNATTSLVATSNITVGGNVTAQQLISTSNTEVGDRLKFSGSNVFVDTLRVADVAANIVTYDRTTGELLDSSGTFMNKFAVVSEQPPSDLFANATTVTNHGGYTLTTSNLATNSNTFNAFDGTANAWVSGDLAGGYIGGANVFHENNLTQLSNLHPTQRGDWLAIEFPYKTTLRHMKLTPLTAAQFPASANIYATNNDLTWTEINYWKDVNPVTASNVQTIVVNATEQFKKYALVATKAAGDSSNVALQDWQLFTESFSIDGGKVAMAQQAATGGETVMNQHGPHGRGVAPLKKYPEIAFAEGKFDSNESTNTYVQAGYTVTASGVTIHDNILMAPWKLLDGISDNLSHRWRGETVYVNNSSTATPSALDPSSPQTQLDTNTSIGEYLIIKTPSKIQLKNIIVNSPNMHMPYEVDIYGRNEGVSTWTHVKNYTYTIPTGTDNSAWNTTNQIIYATEYYSEYAFVIVKTNGRTAPSIGELQLYGYEELATQGDTSIDTTFTSIMNTPQTTGAQVYVDGNLGETFTNRVVGPTVSNTHTTYVSAEKYWELSGNVESNVTLEANTFLSGDAPHSLSMWFNSSNLEANVSNSCIFSLGTEERLDHVSVAFSNNYQTVQKLVASDAEADDRFGFAVAMNSDGTKFIVGAFQEHAGGLSDAGAAYIFTYNSDTGNWDERKLVSPDIEAGAKFGISVGMNSDGTKVIVGAFEDDEGASDTGAAYIFTYSNGSWDFGTKIVAPDKEATDKFGYSAAMSGDGTKVIVGAYIEDHNVAGGEFVGGAGSAYIYTYDGSNWDTGTKIVASDRAVSDVFGRSVAINSDGTKVIVGADTGRAAYIFTYNSGTSNWDEQQILVASGTPERFGYAVAMNSNGTKVIVGAYAEDVGGVNETGAAYIYTYDGSNWDTGTKIVASDRAAGDRFGVGVEMNSDGTKVIVAAYLEHADGVDNAGAAYIFTYDGSNWDTGLKITAPDKVDNDQFSSDKQGVAMSGDGARVIVGAQVDDDNGTSSGSVYVYDRDTTHHLMTDLKLQSNTWHNLTYAYQGEGGSRVTYLDGRKVAEDQAEDTFGDYPPFAMTGYSQGGYVASASSKYDNTVLEYRVFDGSYTNAGAWISGADGYDTNGIADNGNGNDFLSGIVGVGSENGAWIKLQMPHKIVLSYLNFYVRDPSSGYHRQPKSGYIYGSNDDSSFDRIGTFTRTTTTAASTPIAVNINATTAYKYIVFQVTATITGGTEWDAVIVDEIELYGHRENDLVRLPDPTNVLKYPHIAMTGYAQRGYVVSASQESGSYEMWRAFNNTSGFWLTGTGEYPSGVYDSSVTGLYNLGTLTGGGSTDNGHYLKLELPHKLKISHVNMHARTGKESQAPKNFKFYGSNDDTNWEQIGPSFSNEAPQDDGTSYYTLNSIKAYKFIGLVVTETVGDDNGRLSIEELKLFGTGVDSIPIQIGGGNIDKVANFRVYDKFIGEDQALEIWDAQKDEFGRAKSSMTLQKGRLGIGTTEPQGSLSVADEPHNLEEFPPRAMTGYKNYFEGHGEFCVSVSSEYDSNYLGYYAFGDITHSGPTNNYNKVSWNSVDAVYSGSSPHTYTGSATLSGNSGEWIKLKCPYKVKISSYTLSFRDQWVVFAPSAWSVVGSNDDENWDIIGSESGITYPAQENVGKVVVKDFTINTVKYYKYIALVVSTLNGANDLNILELRYFGTREQGQSVLHDGQLTLTKNLTVPRIGPALDADDTPRRDRLVVEYNTSTNPTFDGGVRDTSGRGNDGVFRGSASYNAVDKAFNFTSHNKDLFVARDNISGVSGDILATVSLWFKTYDTTQTSGMTMFQIGHSNSTGDKLMLFLYQDDVYMSMGGSSYVYAPSNDVIRGKWTHVVGIKKGTGAVGTGSTNSSHNSVFEIYIDGVKKAVTSWTGTDILNIDRENQMITVGAGSTNSSTRNNGFDGYISNVKFWGGVALTASEAKTLYDMGRCDEGHHVVNFSKTRVGIGLGDGEAPRGTLDVRDKLIVGHGAIKGSTVGVGDLEVIGSISIGALGAGVLEPSVKFYDTSGGNARIFLVSNDVLGFEVAGYTKGYLRPDSGTVWDNFTGQHRTFIKDVPFSQVSNLEGLIVSSDQNKYIKMSGGIEAGSNAITTNESLPIVSLSNVVTDKKCFGVISASEDPEQREEEYGNFVSVTEKEKGDTRVYINSVGEGAIWVSNIGGNLEAGDYITTSNVAGYGQKQDSDSLKNYTVAKITMDCDFNPATQPVQQILRSNVIQTYYLGDVHKVKSVPHEFVTTTVGADDAWSNVSVKPSDVTYAEWSNLEANTQNTYTLTYTQTSNVVYDTKYTLTTTANVTESDAWDSVFVDPPDVTYAEYSNLEANTQSSYSLTFTKTTTDEKTPEEWSALESNTQSLYNMVYYQSVEEEVASDYPGATTHTRVTDVIENELDAHGQIQWEDHPTETEKAYKIRYLDASGAQTDSANAVHIAAFVGCTYHCG